MYDGASFCFRLRPPTPCQRIGSLRGRRVAIANHRHRLHHEVLADESGGSLPAGEGASAYHQPQPQLHGSASRVGAMPPPVAAGLGAVL